MKPKAIVAISTGSSGPKMPGNRQVGDLNRTVAQCREKVNE